MSAKLEVSLHCLLDFLPAAGFTAMTLPQYLKGPSITTPCCEPCKVKLPLCQMTEEQKQHTTKKNFCHAQCTACFLRNMHEVLADAAFECNASGDERPEDGAILAQ